METALNRIIAKAGGTVALARQLKISPQAISQWKRIPRERLTKVAHLTGVPLENLITLSHSQKTGGLNDP